MKRLKATVKKLFTDWRFYAIVSGTPIAIFILIALTPKLFLLFAPLIKNIYGLTNMPPEFWRGFGIATLIMLAFAVILVLVFPILLFVLSKIKCYISFSTACLFNGHKIRITRFPLASLFGIDKKPDLRISIDEKEYCIHFIDFIFRFRRQFVLVDERNYCITKTAPDSVAPLGYGHFDGLFMSRYVYVAASHGAEGDNFKKIPEFELAKNTTQVIMLSPKPLSAKLVSKNKLEDLLSGTACGNIVYYTQKGFLSLLKR